MNNHKYIFVIGLHKSGTSIFTNSLKEHPLISGFHNTGFPEDEGQFLQTVFPAAKVYGGPGIFGFNKAMHYTEKSSVLTPENSNKLIKEWSSYWDLSKPFLLEKSPPNLLKTRFLQQIFPNSYFIVITRHPLAVSYATQKWSKTSIDSLIKHWYTCYKIFSEDEMHLKNVLHIRYEDVVLGSVETIKNISEFLKIDGFTIDKEFDIKVNDNYMKPWNDEINHLGRVSKAFVKFKYSKIERFINKFGYSLFGELYL
jgi:hypothetical protein